MQLDWQWVTSQHMSSAMQHAGCPGQLSRPLPLKACSLMPCIVSIDRVAITACSCFWLLEVASCELHCFVLTMASLQELQARLDELKAEQKRARAERGKEAQRQKRSSGQAHVARILHDAGSANKAPILPKHVASELILLLDLAGFYDARVKSSAIEVVASYVLGQGRPEKSGNHGFDDVWDKGTRANICAGVELLYIYTDESLLTPGEYNLNDSQLSKFCKYSIECRLFTWLLDQNCRKGVLPGTSSLLTQAAEFVPAAAPGHVRTGLRKYF